MSEQKPGQAPLRLRVLKPEELADPSMASLRRLLRLRRDHFDELNKDGLNLLDRSIFGVYTDCVDSGRKEAADTLIDSVLPKFMDKREVTKDEIIPAEPKPQKSADKDPNNEGSLGSVVFEED